MSTNNSGGPRTEKGKAISSQNALKHGLCSARAVVQGEDEEEYRDLVQGLTRRLKPKGMLERALVKRIADAAWRLRRAVLVETLAIEDNIKAIRLQDEKMKDHPWHVGGNEFSRAFMRAGIPLLDRYESRLERCLFRSLRMLEDIQSTRARFEKLGCAEILAEEESETNNENYETNSINHQE